MLEFYIVVSIVGKNGICILVNNFKSNMRVFFFGFDCFEIEVV